MSTPSTLTSNCSQQSHILLKQQLFQTNHELQLLKIHNHNLLSQIAQLKQKEHELKHLNSIILLNLNNKSQQVNDQIKLKIEGEFLNNRIRQLQLQLQKYKNGVCDSVDRRVKKIVNQYTREQQLQQQKRKSQLSLNKRNSRPSLSSKPPINTKKASDYYETHEHKYYNIEYNNYINSERDYSADNMNNYSADNMNNNSQSQFILQNNQSSNQIRQKYSDHNNSTKQRYQRENRSNSRDQQSQSESVCVPYNVNLVRNFGKCEKCIKLKQIIADKDQYITQLQDRLRKFIQYNSNHHINSNNQNNQNNSNTNNQNNSNTNNQNNNPKPNRQQSYTESQSITNNTDSSSSQQVQQWKLKYLQLLKLYENLKQQYQSLTQQYQSLTSNNQPHYQSYQSHTQQDYNQNININDLQDSQSFQSYTITHSPISGFKKKLTYPINNNTYKNNNTQTRVYIQDKQKERESQMLQQITNLVNGLGGANNKHNRNSKITQKQYNNNIYQKSTTTNNMMFNDKKSRVSQVNNMSRISTTTNNNNKLDNSVFTIKQGVNRYGTNNPFF